MIPNSPIGLNLRLKSEANSPDNRKHQSYLTNNENML